MSEKKTAPKSLKIIAWLFILSGLSSIVSILLALMNNKISINMGVIGLFIGMGLLKGSKFWRNWTLIVTFLSFILIPLVIIFILGNHPPIDIKLFGLKIGKISTEIGIIFCVIILLLSFWQYQVLKRKDVLVFFGIEEEQDGSK